MVPGTNVQYTDPTIPPVWLVDTKDVNGDGNLETIPALTTIDFTLFKSINWPRERYLSAIEKARNGQQDFSIEGWETENPRILSGIVHVTGDYGVGSYGPGQGEPNTSLNMSSGTVFVINTNENNHLLPDTIDGKIEFWFNSNQPVGTTLLGTEQRPIIWTSIGVVPQGQDWQGLSAGGQFQERYNLMEFSASTLTIRNDNIKIHNNIIRNSEMITHIAQTYSLLCRASGTSIEANELHNNYIAIGLADNPCVTKNRIYNNKLNNGTNPTEGIGTDNILDRETRTISQNIIIKCEWGVACEDDSDSNIYVNNNISALNNIGIMMYCPLGTTSNPTLEGNNVWENWAGYAIPNTIPSNYVKTENWRQEGEYLVADYNNKNSDYEDSNISRNPNFRNIKIYDLAHDTDNDGIFSDIEERNGTDPWVADTK